MRLLAEDPQAEEVFSRTANPAQWYIAQRGSKQDASSADLYVAISRKEASLVDVETEAMCYSPSRIAAIL